MARWDKSGRRATAASRRQRRQSSNSPHAIRTDDFIQPPLVGGDPRSIGLRMPQMQHAGRKAPILASRTAANEAHNDVGILSSPSVERGVETVDPNKVFAPNRKIGSASIPPIRPRGPPQNAERERCQRQQAIDLALNAPRYPF